MKKILLNNRILQFFWTRLRKGRILRKHNQVASYCRTLITRYAEGRLEKFIFQPKRQIESQMVVWQYWGQGVDDPNMPEVVKNCFVSVDKFKGDYTIIRVDSNTIHDYIDIPSHILDKFNAGIINHTFFSDIIRLHLLYCYGGVWLDATILLTGPLNKEFASMGYFMFQRNPHAVQKSFWENSYSYYWGWDDQFKVRVLNSIIYASKGNRVIHTLLDLLTNYWKIENKALDYFIFQIIYEELLSGKMRDYRCPITDDTIPHILQTIFNNPTSNFTYQNALKLTSTHKMSYFNDKSLHDFHSFYIKHILEHE